MPASASPDHQPQAGAWYSYAVIRVVPRVDREEFLNVGVILFARTRGFLEARVHFDPARLLALHAGADIETIAKHLESFQAVARGNPAGGPVAALDPSQRFHWLTSPRSTAIQTSTIHVGFCQDPSLALDDLMRDLVLPA